MRTLRLSLVGVVALAVLGLGDDAVAQDAEDPTVTVTPVSGEQVGDRVVRGGVPRQTDWGVQLSDAIYEHDILWSDPRLPSLMRLHENLNAYSLADDRAAYSWVGNIRLEGEEGIWTGAEYGMGEDSDEGLVLRPRMMLLTGEGAYAGLSAMLQRQAQVVGTGGSPVYEGYIYEGDLPSMPEPLEPSTD